MCLCLSVCLVISYSVHRSVCLFDCDYLSVFLFVCLSVYMSNCLSVCVLQLMDPKLEFPSHDAMEEILEAKRPRQRPDGATSTRSVSSSFVSHLYSITIDLN